MLTEGDAVARKRSKSLKKPKIYDALRKKGYSKTKSAKISNAIANHTAGKKRKK
jgi:hypothetical protein